MSLETEHRRRPRVPPEPDFDAEREVDVRKYWAAVVARWWLPLVGLLIGVALGYLAARGGGKTYQAKAVLTLGTPLAVGGGVLPNVQTNASAVRQVVTAEANIQLVARSVGLTPGKLRKGVSATPVGGGAGAARLGPVTLFTVTVKGSAPRKAARAANQLARIVVQTISAQYVDRKIATLRSQVEADKRELAALDKRVAQQQRLVRTLTGAEQLAAISIIGIAEQRRSVVTQDLLSTQPLLAQAETVERGRILTRAVASKTTARSVRNSVLVAGALGLLLGALAAILWEPVLGRSGRRPA